MKVALAVTPWVITPLPAGMAVRACLIAIVLAIPLNALLWLDFTRTILGTFAFHFSAPFQKLGPGQK